ncbi:1,6-anhydro-N-acetylmuramyl-L-alanine amidase AmpD [Burkholderiaceae bacterium DAT-1]|nr:1,6-anhydro-N-acetylmuramyl-L-alanine amidase AmpD [Burkholderiaceae bacterium DAT-1]
MNIAADGWLQNVRRLVSPHADARPSGVAIDMIVIHCISLPAGEFGGDAILDLFSNTMDAHRYPSLHELVGLKVSAHFLIRRDGEIIQFVPTSARAWHAGQSLWKGRDRCNDFSVGIELEGTDDSAYTDDQYGSLNELLDAVCQRYPVQHVVGHEDIAPNRKTDPGRGFEWNRIGERPGLPDRVRT